MGNGICEQTNYKWQRSLFEMAQVKQEVSYAEVTPAQAVRSGKVAVTVRIAGAEAELRRISAFCTFQEKYGIMSI